MQKIIFILTFLTLSLLARQEAFPTQQCPAFNNMKHTANTHKVQLDTKQKYTILNHHKGQMLVLIKGENPAQRWVDEHCFPQEKPKQKSQKDSINKKAHKATKNTHTSKHTNKYDNHNTKKYINKNIFNQTLLALSWHNAFCQTHRYKKECKRSLTSLIRSNPNESRFVLHGLWPQPKNNVYCDVDKELVYADKNKRWRDLPCLALDEEVEEELEKVMPGFASDLHKHEWVKHGTCYGTDANRYYADAVSLLKQLNDSEVGKLFKENIGKRVSIAQVKNAFNRAFGMGAGNHVQMQCKHGMITELWLLLGSGSDDLGTLLQRGKRAFSRCDRGLVDRAGF